MSQDVDEPVRYRIDRWDGRGAIAVQWTGCRCRDEEAHLRVHFEPCETGCGVRIAWLTREHLFAAGWHNTSTFGGGFFESSVHATTTVQHEQRWHRHTPERCQARRAERRGQST